MTMKLRLGGAWKDIISGKVFAGGSWRSLVAVQVYADGDWRKVANFVTAPAGMTATASPAAASARTGTQTNSVTITPSGGLAPYTYAWTISTSPAASTVTNPSSATTAFNCSGLGPPGSGAVGGNASCMVTDSLSSTVTVTVPVSFKNLDTGTA